MLCQQLEQLYQNAEYQPLLAEPAYTAGSVFAICSAPEIPMPEVWMPWLISSFKHSSVNKKQADTIAEALLEQLRFQLSIMRNEQQLKPDGCQWSTNGEERQCLELWLQGLLSTHQKLEPSWQSAWSLGNDEDAQCLRRCLKSFSYLADSDQAVLQVPEDKKEAMQEGLPILAKQLETLLRDYVALAGRLAQTLPGQFDVEPKSVSQPPE